LQLEVASGLDEYRKRAEASESKIIRLEEDNIRLNRENERFRDQVDSITEQLSQMERELRDERQSRQDAVEALARMKTNFERAEDQLAR
jgi:predicted RNase H-like nuclease (RuvC/YqgF family)